jgi:RimJ/RimL family protein N-acetyltransferase
MIRWVLTSMRCALRPAEVADARPLWRLNNDPVVRRTAFTPDPIPFDSHERWFHAKLRCSASRMFVAYQADSLVGQVRYDRAGDAAEIDFSVLPALHGAGLGSALLASTWREACEQLGAPLARGLVLAHNQPSARAFRRAGFTLAGERSCDNQRTLVFERRVEEGSDTTGLHANR